MVSATNERQIRARKDQSRRDRLTDEIVTKALMAYTDGRRWVWLRLSEAEIFVEGESLDPATLAYQKGRRNAGLRLLKDVTTFTPLEYITMTEEATKLSLFQNPQEEASDE